MKTRLILVSLQMLSILDSSTETPQYKIVFASYNVKAAKVTFVERVLS